MRSASSLGRGARLAAAVGAAALMVLAVAACGGGGSNGSSSSTTTGGTATTAVKQGGTLTFALDEDLAGFNVLNASSSEFVLAEILDQVWPSVYIVQPDLTTVLNKDVVTSAKLTKKNPQTIVYNINPKATWSDGTPINAEDFIYNWQSQSGDPKFKDVGGKAYEAASTSGYNQIKSVTGSNGGKTVTVVYSKPYGDWKALFSPMIPAHISQKAGFNNGWSTFGAPEKVSGGPFMIASYAKGSNLIEVPNPKYWGTDKAKLSKLVFRFILDDSQQAPAVQNGEVNMVNPALPGLDFYDSLNTISGFKVAVDPGLEFQHMDFNEANPYLAKVQIRRAIAWGTDRAQIAGRTGGEISHGLRPLQNRLYMPTQPEFKDTERRLRQVRSCACQEDAAAVRHDDGLRRLLPPELRTAEGQGLHAQDLDDGRRAGPFRHRAALQGADEVDRHQDQHQQLHRQQALRHDRPEERVRHHRVRVGEQPVRIGQPAHLLLVHEHGSVRRELGPLRRPAGGQAVRPGAVDADPAKRPRSTTTRSTASSGRTWRRCRCSSSRSCTDGRRKYVEHRPEHELDRHPLERKPVGRQSLVIIRARPWSA